MSRLVRELKRASEVPTSLVKSLPEPAKVTTIGAKARVFIKDDGFGQTSFSRPSSLDLHHAKFDKTYILGSCPYCTNHKPNFKPIQIAQHVRSVHPEKWKEFSAKYQFLK
ncbi:hypothetical protein ACP3VU_19235 [Vibrio sp. PNB23_22_6]